MGEGEEPAGRAADVDELVRRLEADLPTAGALPVLSQCLRLKEIGRSDLARAYLQTAQHRYPDEPAIGYELALVVGDEEVDRSRWELRRALERAPHFENAFRALAFLELRHDRMAEFDALLRRDPIGRDISFTLKVELSQLYVYLGSLGRSPSASGRYANALSFGLPRVEGGVTSAFHAILDAVRTPRPFALVRLGDGEGAMWRFSYDEEITNLSAYRGHREHFSWRWYGRPYAETHAALEALQARFEAALPGADIVAAPSREWIAHEAQSANIRTFIACVNAARGSFRGAHPTAMRQATEFHYELLATGGLSEIISAAGKVCLVSSHPEIAAVLHARFPSLVEVHRLIVPPAASDIEVTGYALSERFYEVYDRVLEQAQRHAHDVVFLVGAGLVGKLLCLELKAAGYAALDIGSIFDMAMAFDTRPNFSLYDPVGQIREGVRYVEPPPGA